MIYGQVLARREKRPLAGDVADELGLPHPYVSEGGSVDSTFLDRAYKKLGGVGVGSDTYRKTEMLLDVLGLTYDADWDSSEGADKGGGTVTTRAFSRMRTALTGVPRCFVVVLPDNGTEVVYPFDRSATGRQNLLEAGPESRLVFYSRAQDAFVGAATVRYLGPNHRAVEWEAELKDYQAFTAPVPRSDLQMPDYDRRRAITEVTHDTYLALLGAGGAGPTVQTTVPTATSQDESDAVETDDGGENVAQKVVSENPTATVPVSITVPGTLPTGTLPLGAVKVPTYSETASGEVKASDPSLLPRRSKNRARDKVAETRAVELATKALQQDGWTLTKDRQKDGCGYDLEFERAGRVLKVEVKGIQAEVLSFNLTPKELWRAETDDCWVVVAVTSVLAPVPKVNLVTRDRVVAATRSVTGYRIQV